ncbi:C-C motif chemokine 16 isoform X1 [Meles meles]|uniref:C-C motif chemokine 16 isoform X1 n=1 Tax=Meles meles TaxID=9662 RepID=UPI001E69E7BB|nr:C-C motif chemokine 16 isoform X1 [Meles meles]
MKVSGAALFLLILILTAPAVHGQSKSGTDFWDYHGSQKKAQWDAQVYKSPASLNSSHTCCLKHHEKVMPRKMVVGYRRALNCYLPAIIFVTKKNREICANPQDKWVQEYIKDPNIPVLPPRN